MQEKNDNRTATIKVRVTPTEKEALEAISKRTGISLSGLIRTAMLAENKVMILDQGAVIADEFCKFNSLLSRFLSSKSAFSDSDIEQVCAKMEEIIHTLHSITQQLTPIDIESDDDEEEEEANVNC